MTRMFHAVERIALGHIDPRAIYGTFPSVPKYTPPDERAIMWSRVLRGWCPVLLVAERLFKWDPLA